MADVNANPNTAYRQYLRRYRVIINRKKNRLDGLDVSDLRIAFSIEKTLSETPGVAKILITNMERKLASTVVAGDEVVIEAGYVGGNYGLLYKGSVIQSSSVRNGDVDGGLSLVCSDCDQFMTTEFVCETMGAGATQADIVKEVAGSDVRGNLTGDLSGAQLARGKVMFGRAADFVSAAARSINAQFYVENGLVNIIGAADYEKDAVVELNKYTGLIGTPEQGDDGITVRCLINPSIKLNTLIYVDASLIQAKEVSKATDKIEPLWVDGMYRVNKMTIEGDTHGDEWTMSIEAVVQEGRKPAYVTTPDGNMWR